MDDTQGGYYKSFGEFRVTAKEEGWTALEIVTRPWTWEDGGESANVWVGSHVLHTGRGRWEPVVRVL